MELKEGDKECYPNAAQKSNIAEEYTIMHMGRNPGGYGSNQGKGFRKWQKKYFGEDARRKLQSGVDQLKHRLRSRLAKGPQRTYKQSFGSPHN